MNVRKWWHCDICKKKVKNGYASYKIGGKDGVLSEVGVTINKVTCLDCHEKIELKKKQQKNYQTGGLNE